MFFHFVGTILPANQEIHQQMEYEFVVANVQIIIKLLLTSLHENILFLQNLSVVVSHVLILLLVFLDLHQI